MAKPTQADAEAAVRVLIEWAGDDPNREGLIDTPGQVARSYCELFASRLMAIPSGPNAVHERVGKTYRLSLGAVAGGAIKLDADEDVEQVLCVGEGR
jgi:hypothetical protein